MSLLLRVCAIKIYTPLLSICLPCGRETMLGLTLSFVRLQRRSTASPRASHGSAVDSFGHILAVSFLFFDAAHLTAQLWLQHVAHVRGTRGVGVDHLLEIAPPQAHADRKRKEIDDLFSVRA